MVGKGGRKKSTWGNSWNHGATKVIRIPAALENQILEYVRALDCGEVPIDPTQLQTAILLAVDQFVESRIAEFHPNQYSRTPNTHTRRWDELRKFRNAIATNARSGSTPESQKVSVHR